MTLEGFEVDWAEGFNGAVTVCDRSGMIVYMNELSVLQFEKQGGAKLLGKNLLDCHPEPARNKLAGMLENPANNVYTIEKNGIRKIIYQTPWNSREGFKGVIEISFVLPPDMPHFIRS